MSSRFCCETYFNSILWNRLSNAHLLSRPDVVAAKLVSEGCGAGHRSNDDKYFPRTDLNRFFFLKQIAVNGLFYTRFQQGFVGSSDFKVLSQDEVQQLFVEQIIDQGLRDFSRTELNSVLWGGIQGLEIFFPELISTAFGRCLQKPVSQDSL